MFQTDLSMKKTFLLSFPEAQHYVEQQTLSKMLGLKGSLQKHKYP